MEIHRDIKTAKRPRLRVELATVSALDETLVRLQEGGYQIINLVPCHGTITGDQTDVGHGRGELAMKMETNFVITYLQTFDYV